MLWEAGWACRELRLWGGLRSLRMYTPARACNVAVSRG